MAAAESSGDVLRWDASHPPTRLRLELLRRHPVRVGRGLPNPALAGAAEAELVGAQARLSRAFRDDLLDRWLA